MLAYVWRRVLWVLHLLLSYLRMLLGWEELEVRVHVVVLLSNVLKRTCLVCSFYLMQVCDVCVSLFAFSSPTWQHTRWRLPLLSFWFVSTCTTCSPTCYVFFCHDGCCWNCLYWSGFAKHERDCITTATTEADMSSSGSDAALKV